MTPDLIKALIRKRAAEAGFDPTHAMTMASIESGFDPRSGAGKGYQGLFQFGPGEWKTYGGGKDIFDPDAQINAYRGYSGQINNTLEQTLGRKPENWEQYLGWQQGAGGASALLANPNKFAVQVVKPEAVRANLTADDIKRLGGDVNRITADQFAGLWRDRYNDHQGRIVGQQQTWQGEGDPVPSRGPTQSMVPADVVANTTPTPTPDRTNNDWDLAGHGSSPKLPDAPRDDAKIQSASSKLTGAGLGLLSAGEGATPQQPAWIQQAMNARGQVHRPQMPGGLLTDIFKDPEEEKRRRMLAGLLGE